MTGRDLTGNDSLALVTIGNRRPVYHAGTLGPLSLVAVTHFVPAKWLSSAALFAEELTEVRLLARTVNLRIMVGGAGHGQMSIVYRLSDSWFLSPYPLVGLPADLIPLSSQATGTTASSCSSTQNYQARIS